MGAIEDKRGLKVAVFLTDKEEVLTGQAGQLVGNRFRIVRIGLESVDIQEVGSELFSDIEGQGDLQTSLTTGGRLVVVCVEV